MVKSQGIEQDMLSKQLYTRSTKHRVPGFSPAPSLCGQGGAAWAPFLQCVEDAQVSLGLL